MKDDLLTARPDYEAMYNNLCEEHKRLCAKYAELEREYESMGNEFSRIRAQLDIVYMIFGK